MTDTKHAGATLEQEAPVALTEETIRVPAMPKAVRLEPIAHPITPLPATIKPKRVKLGMQVGYVLATGRKAGESRTAFVVKLWGGDPIDTVNLQVLTDGLNDYEHPNSGLMWATSVTHDEARHPGTWHFLDEEE